MERFILDHSTGPVEETKAESRTIQFIHESVRDIFLQGKGLDKPFFGPAAMFPARSHASLKQCCQNYFLGVDATSDLALDGSLPKASSEDSAELRQRRALPLHRAVNRTRALEKRIKHPRSLMRYWSK
ncbi:hypothetical protein GJ744_003411 [Endocarpon pusillum]|uniref:Uncharacterized protein n=1 Tax=Endocarpon pusillum TaxID=364733 RepID=A0A8H7A7R0_9EURO|nr:hypothetical protein GJ744_003411 [Endocarpon pusillum]